MSPEKVVELLMSLEVEKNVVSLEQGSVESSNFFGSLWLQKYWLGED